MPGPAARRRACRAAAVAVAALELAALDCTALALAGPSARAAQVAPCPRGAAAMARVDLFFGAGRVSRPAWARFLAEAVTPRFPDGLTSYQADGQWRGRRGLVRERSRVIVILFKPSPATSAAIDTVRAAYRRRFHQTSVLRADSSACVSF